MRLYNGVRVVNRPSPYNVERIDFGALPLILRMSARGLQVNLEHFARLDIGLTQDMDRTTEEVHTMTGHYVNLGSGDQVADLLFKKLGLKQIRPKMTSSGSRESVEDEVLTAIQHEHPVVALCQNYKEYEKLRGTYVRPMPKLARRTKFGVWRMYPNFKTTRVPSGRLSCSDPNLLAMPTRTERGRDIRKGFITDPGWVYVSVDECLHPSTSVKTLTGDKPISTIRPGDKVLTHRGDTIKWGTVTKSSWIKPRKAYKVTFDNGESVIASDTHRWPIQMTPLTGKSVIQEIETQNLRQWDRAVPCKEFISPVGYRCYYSHRGSYSYSSVHELIADAYLGPKPPSVHVHHKNEDKLDNSPSNLEYLNNREHTAYHGRLNYPKQDHVYRIAKLREGIKKRESYVGEANPNSKLSDVDLDVIETLVTVDGWTASRVADYFGLSYGYARRLVNKFYSNHRVVSIEPVGVQPMWAITVEPDHNYVLSCGVVTCNSQIEVRIAAHRSGDDNLIRVYQNEEDIYSDFATTAFKLEDKRFKPEGKKWKYPTVHDMHHRRPAKTCVLASIYDVTAKGLTEQMPVICANCLKPTVCSDCADGKPSHVCVKHDCGRFRTLWGEAKCQDLINAFYLRYPGLLRMRLADHAHMRRHAMICDMWGRLQHIGGARSIHEWIVQGALREGCNLPMQGGAQGTIKLVMGQFNEDTEGMDDIMYPLLQVHDELVLEVREDCADEIIALLINRFENCCKLRVPLKASGAKATSWGTLPK